MTRWTKSRIYNRELEKAYAEGFEGPKAERIASERTEEIYWDMVDEGYQRAKDRDMERNRY